jgi:ADP-heptose:LPS heptosyltransferase
LPAPPAPVSSRSDLRPKKAIFLSLNALGDILCTTPALSAYRRAHPAEFIIYVTLNSPFARVLDDNPDIDYVLYSERLYVQGLKDYSKEWLLSLPLDLREPATLFHLDLNLVCNTPEAFRQHLAQCFAKLAQVQIDSVRPSITLTPRERSLAATFTSRPYAVFSMRSNANPPREDGRGGRKDWPEEHWRALAVRLSDEAGLDIIAVGAERDPQSVIPGVRNLYGLPVKVAAALLESAACVITLESGAAHLAAAVDAPTVVIYSNLMPLEWARPADSTACRVLYGDPFDQSVARVFEAVQEVVSMRSVAA